MRHTDCCSVCLCYSLSHGSFLECREIRSVHLLHSVYNRSINSSRRRPFLFTYRCLAFAVFFAVLVCLCYSSVVLRQLLCMQEIRSFSSRHSVSSVRPYFCPFLGTPSIHTPLLVLGTPPFPSSPRYAIPFGRAPSDAQAQQTTSRAVRRSQQQTTSRAVRRNWTLTTQ